MIEKQVYQNRTAVVHFGTRQNYLNLDAVEHYENEIQQ